MVMWVGDATVEVVSSVPHCTTQNVINFDCQKNKGSNIFTSFRRFNILTSGYCSRFVCDIGRSEYYLYSVLFTTQISYVTIELFLELYCFENYIKK